MELTKEQIESAEKGEVVRITTGTGELVIVKADVYDEVTGLSDEEPVLASLIARFSKPGTASPAPTILPIICDY